MKTTTLLLAISAATLMSASAATFAVRTGTGNSVTGIGDSTGNGFQGTEGIAAIGVFSSTEFASFTSVAQFNAAFTAFGAPASVNFNPAGVFGNNGVFGYNPAGLAANDPFVGQQTYLFVGNAATFDAATEVLVVNTGRAFSAADDAVATPQDIIIGSNLEVAFGGRVANIPTNGTDQSINPGLTTLAPIPEPSAVMLGLLSAFGLIRRRR